MSIRTTTTIPITTTIPMTMTIRMTTITTLVIRERFRSSRICWPRTTYWRLETVAGFRAGGSGRST